MKNIFSLIFIFLIIGFSTPAYAIAPIISTFDVNTEGWTADGALVSHVVNGGNPGGFLRLEDNRDDTYTALPPSKFLGNLFSFNGGVLTYEILVLNPSDVGSIGSGFGRIQLHGGGSNATFDYAGNPPIPSSQSWTTYFVPFNADSWNTTQANWELILSDVTSFSIIYDLQPGDDTIGLDNFRLAPVPEPSTILLFSSGLIGIFVRKRKKE